VTGTTPQENLMQLSTTSQVDLGVGELRPEPSPSSAAVEATGGPSAATRSSRLDRRVPLAAAALLAPVAMAAQYLLAPPGLPRDEAAGFLGGIAADTGRYTASVTSFLASMAFGIAAAAVLALAGRRRAPWASGAAAALLVLGSVGGAGFGGLRLVAVHLTEDGTARPGAVEVWQSVQSGIAFNTLTPFLLMAIVGTLVGVVALVRARHDVTVWAAPAYLVGFVLTSGEFPQWVSVVGAAVQVAGMLPVVRAALRD
jgi:hypothetical protein